MNLHFCYLNTLISMSFFFLLNIFLWILLFYFDLANCSLEAYIEVNNEVTKHCSKNVSVSYNHYELVMMTTIHFHC